MKRTALLVAPLLALAACGSDGSDDAAGGGDRLEVVTSFYPLQYAVQQVGGDRVEASNLTRPGAEPHDLELSPKDVLSVAQADSVVYLADFQPAVDDAITEADGTAFDVTKAARLDLAATDDGHDHGGESAEEHAGHDHGSQDPHFWLDPQRYADVADAIAGELGRVDPDHAAEYEQNAKDMRTRLDSLDASFREGLKDCQTTDLVTSHAAFGYLADAYGLTQESITGLTPETEPSAQAMKDVVEHIREHDVPTVYAETLVPKDVAETIAKEADAQVMVLDPIEGVTDESSAQDYFGIMEANLTTLEKGQSCS
ncbi:metal ABC transporter substrate-binding protein [Janibacter sp. Y6]|uniref:metal ABC transporter substrate-binding protein n=1 Tax=Janibacter sp. Y6 TaxID=2913552 RepID=UPI0034A364AB